MTYVREFRKVTLDCIHHLEYHHVEKMVRSNHKWMHWNNNFSILTADKNNICLLKKVKKIYFCQKVMPYYFCHTLSKKVSYRKVFQLRNLATSRYQRKNKNLVFQDGKRRMRSKSKTWSINYLLYRSGAFHFIMGHSLPTWTRRGGSVNGQ